MTPTEKLPSTTDKPTCDMPPVVFVRGRIVVKPGADNNSQADLEKRLEAVSKPRINPSTPSATIKI